jgi:hypothetical protein
MKAELPARQWVDPEMVGGLTMQAEKANKEYSEQTGE